MTGTATIAIIGLVVIATLVVGMCYVMFARQMEAIDDHDEEEALGTGARDPFMSPHSSDGCD